MNTNSLHSIAVASDEIDEDPIDDDNAEADPKEESELREAITVRRGRPELYQVIDGQIGSLHPDLLEQWWALKEGDPCPRDGTSLTMGWLGPECESCMREYGKALGCTCEVFGEHAAVASRFCPVCYPDD